MEFFCRQVESLNDCLVSLENTLEYNKITNEKNKIIWEYLKKYMLDCTELTKSNKILNNSTLLYNYELQNYIILKTRLINAGYEDAKLWEHPKLIHVEKPNPTQIPPMKITSAYSDMQIMTLN